MPGPARVGVEHPLSAVVRVPGWSATRLACLQGFSTGGEYGGASTFIAEYAPDKRRGYYGSFLEFGTLIGYTAAAGQVTILTVTLADSSMNSWGWRIPFLAAAALLSPPGAVSPPPPLPRR